MDTSKDTAKFRAEQWIQIIKNRWQNKIRNSACNSMTKAGEISAPVPKCEILILEEVVGELKISNRY